MGDEGQQKGFWTAFDEIAPSTPERRIWSFSTRAGALAGVLKGRGLPWISAEAVMDLLAGARSEQRDLPWDVTIDRATGDLTFTPKKATAKAES